ncbi:YebC/PmpR family DNA-binding transcriptional regulator [bacterium NHP-B]|nr:YebC/PmpR family DNA-binding transcriptional regulator [bacterium NHP-B]
MAGHSQFKNIMHRKGAQDAKRAKVFTKIIREITVAAQMGGPDVDANPRLRTALLAARAANMPKDNIERAIKKGSGEASDVIYNEMRYEGYGPGGVAIIIEALTDNRNRTAAEVRSILTKHGGRMADTGSVTFVFKHKGMILYGQENNEEALLEASLNAGTDDFIALDDGFEISAPKEAWHTVREQLEKEFGPPLNAALVWVPDVMVTLGDKKESFTKLVNLLEDCDDVQAVWHNAEGE